MNKYAIAYVATLVGAVVSSIGINTFFIPHHLLSGGITGIAIMLHYATGFPVGTGLFVMALGASYGGARAMTGTSGGGFSLMVEALGLSGMAEIPLVVIDVQRPGPVTGLPTRTEQSDLKFVISASQGEFPRMVIALRNAHGYCQGLSQGTCQTEYNAGKNTAAGCRNDDPGNGLPARRPQSVGGLPPRPGYRCHAFPCPRIHFHMYIPFDYLLVSYSDAVRHGYEKPIPRCQTVCRYNHPLRYRVL